MIQAKRKRVWDYYYENLSAWANLSDVRLPFVPENCEHPYHMFHLILNSLEERTALISHLRARKVNAIFHYQPLNLSKMGRRVGNQRVDCPVSEAVSQRLLRLPFYNALTEEEQLQVVSGVKELTTATQRIS